MNLSPEQIIAAHLQSMRSAGGRAKAARMSRADRVAMSARMIAAKRLKKAARGMGGNALADREG